jgi:hypothetical protein
MRAWLLAALLVAGCGTSRVVASDPRAAIYVDGAFAGHGAAELRKRGAPRTAHVEARYPSGARATRVVKRRFTAATLVAGLLTYGVGFFAVWELPDEIALPPPASAGWDADPAEDPWMRPPGGAVKSTAW